MVLGPRIGNDGSPRVPARPASDIAGLAGQQPGSADRPKTKRRVLPSVDPYDLTTAFARLKQLLSRDAGEKPSTRIPNRGFYLNILV